MRIFRRVYNKIIFRRFPDFISEFLELRKIEPFLSWNIHNPDGLISIFIVDTFNLRFSAFSLHAAIPSVYTYSCYGYRKKDELICRLRKHPQQ